MAQLMAEPGPGRPDERPAAFDIPASTQLLAIAWMRWRMFVNGFRRQTNTGKVAAVVFSIVLRLLLWPIFAMWVVGPAFGSGFLAWMAISNHHPENLAPLLGGIALFWQFVAINGASIAATLSTFDPASLLRYPLRFGRYLVLRLLLGLLTPSTLIGCFALVGATIGIAVADLSLAPAALIVLGVYAAMNIFLSRMLAIWLERWLSTRRAREIFGGMMALFFVGVQFVNFRHTTAHGHARGESGSWLLNFVQGSNHALNLVPPGYATQSILLGAQPVARLAQFAALLLWTATFFAAFAYRLHKQFLGEYLSEGAARSTAATVTRRTHPQPLALPQAQPATYNLQPATALLSPTIAACLRKEWVYLRGNGNQLIAMLTPLAFVFIFSRGILAHHPDYLLPGAIGYAVMGLLAQLYNVFGADGAGVQLYLLSPARLRDVVLAKNIASMTMLLVEVALAWTVAAVLSTAPISLAAQFSAGSWILFILFTNLTVGTLRSIQAPSKISIAQTRRMRPAPASKTSGLIVLAILFGSILLQVPVTLLCRYFHNPWLAVWIFAPLAVVAIAAYGWLLNNAERLILTYRDQFAQELCGD
jgi:ABC-2 type transport system permease protein